MTINDCISQVNCKTNRSDDDKKSEDNDGNKHAIKTPDTSVTQSLR